MADRTTSRDPDSPAPVPSTLAGRYVIDRELGRGATATVYLARDTKYDRLVAVKTLSPDLAYALGPKRFLREIEITARLQHPNILAIHDSGEADGLLFYVTPYLEGDSLRARLSRERQLPLDAALKITTQLADALQHAHASGIVHRDIKPENIMFSGGHACIGDFGIAQAIQRAGGDRLTTTGLVLGTPAYMSPEQAAGQRELDGRSDQYSLACVLYEMLAGIAPFIGPTPESVVAQRFSQTPRPVRAFRAGVPPHVDGALTRALSLAPADRFADLGGFAEALVTPASTPSGYDAESLPAGSRPLLALTRRSRATMAFAGTTAALSLIALGWLAGSRRRPVGVPEAGPHQIEVAEGTVDPVLRAAAGDVTGAIVESLGQWRDARITLGSSGDSVWRVPTGVGVSDQLGSRSVILWQLAPVGDSAELTVRRVSFNGEGPVFDAQLQQVTLPGRAGADAVRLARRLFAADNRDSVYALSASLTRLGAWRDFTFGLRALRSWQIAAADHHFSQAVMASNDFAPARFWAVQLDALSDPNSPSAAWVSSARQLERLIVDLRGRDSSLALSLVQIARGQSPAALATLDGIVSTDSTDAMAWIDRGIALARDRTVVADSTSPTGWRFRSAYRSAYDAFMRAARLDTRVRAALPVFQVASLLLFRPATLREGRALFPDTTTFYALPSMVGDSVALIPVPAAVFTRGAVPPTVAQAVAQNQRQLSADLAEWVRADSSGGDAFRIISELLEVRGDLSGSDPATSAEAALARALRLETSRSKRLELEVAQLRLLLKLERFAEVRRGAERLLGEAGRSGVGSPALLRGVAALIGDRETAADLEFQLSRSPGYGSPAASDPALLARAYSRFRAYATVGACSPHTNALLDSLLLAIDRFSAPAERSATVQRLVQNSAVFAVQCIGASRVAALVAPSTPVARMIQAIASGDRNTLVNEVSTLRRERSGARPSDVTPDYALVEAWLLLQAGDTAAAVANLDAQVLSFAALTPRVLDESSTAGAIGRAMLLRSRLTRGDLVQTRHWAAAAEALLGKSTSQ